MKECKKCGERIPLSAMVDGKQRNFQHRKYCLDCSPFGSGNRSKLEIGPEDKKERKTFFETAKTVKWQRKARSERKQLLITEFGGGCKICGYNKCSEALDFHHLDPSQKKFCISYHGLLRKWEEVLEEAKKCELLCCRCHAEFHAFERKSAKD